MILLFCPFLTSIGFPLRFFAEEIQKPTTRLKASDRAENRVGNRKENKALRQVTFVAKMLKCLAIMSINVLPHTNFISVLPQFGSWG